MQLKWPLPKANLPVWARILFCGGAVIGAFFAVVLAGFIFVIYPYTSCQNEWNSFGALVMDPAPANPFDPILNQQYTWTGKELFMANCIDGVIDAHDVAHGYEHDWENPDPDACYGGYETEQGREVECTESQTNAGEWTCSGTNAEWTFGNCTNDLFLISSPIDVVAYGIREMGDEAEFGGEPSCHPVYEPTACGAIDDLAGKYLSSATISAQYQTHVESGLGGRENTTVLACDINWETSDTAPTSVTFSLDSNLAADVQVECIEDFPGLRRWHLFVGLVSAVLLFLVSCLIFGAESKPLYSEPLLDADTVEGK